MRIALSTIGTTGDVQPFLALALRLKGRGHAVRLCTHGFFREKVEAQGIEFVATAPELTIESVNAQLELFLKILNPVRAAGYLIEHFLLKDAAQRYDDCLSAFAGCDVAVCHHADFAGQEAALALGLPWASVIYSPEPLPTRESAPWPFFRLSLGRRLNGLLWRLGHWLLERQVRRALRVLSAHAKSERLETVGVIPVSPHLNMVAVSRHVALIEADLPDAFTVTGSWHLAEDATYVPDAGLAAFLAAGPPPVVVSFGSMGAGDGERVAKIVMRALRLSGQRAIVQKGWGNIDVQGDSQIYAVGYVPHGYLFKQASCVIHHGGAGTTAAACRAGKPSIVVPHIADQFYWARSLAAHGVAPFMLHRLLLSPRRLARRIRKVLGDSAYSERARQLGDRLSREDGLEAAVTAIEAMPRATRGA